MSTRGNPLNPQKAPRPKSERQFEFEGHVVTIIHDPERGPLHHWIIQPLGSNDLRHWGQQRTEEEAERAAISCILHSDCE